MKKGEQKKSAMSGKAKENVATGAGAAVGGVAGTFVGASIPLDAQGEEIVAEEVAIDGGHKNSHVSGHASQKSADNMHTEPTPEVTPESTPEPTPESEPKAEPEAEPEVEGGEKFSDHIVDVVDYETQIDENGNPVDVALVTVDGQAALILDYDLDGVADSVMIDENGNGGIEANEVHAASDIYSDPISMEPLRDEFAQFNNENEGPDYINNADVSDFSA